MCGLVAGFTGTLCITGAPNNCVANYCANQGTCVETPSGPICCCVPGYCGERCDKCKSKVFKINKSANKNTLFYIKITFLTLYIV